MILLISTLKVVVFSRKLSNFHWLKKDSLSPSPTYCTGTSIRLSPSSSLFLSLCHSNIFINMTVIIPPMTKHARLCQNCLPKYIFIMVSRDDAQEFRQEKRTKITYTQCNVFKVFGFFPPSYQSYYWHILLSYTCVRAGRCREGQAEVRVK